MLSRTGAEWTFDGAAFVANVAAVRACSPTPVRAPSFDHAVGDPVPDAVVVATHTRFVLVEGNYLFLSEPPWDALPSLLDERSFMDVPPETAMQRIVRRHVVVGATEEQAQARAAGSDALNARLVWTRRHAARPHVAVPSFDETQ
jgi:pantothenate kinase